jgi:flavin-dependent dehydrogenase
MEERFDMVVVGAGPAGAVSTEAMREATLYVTGFQRRRIFGTGIAIFIPRL